MKLLICVAVFLLAGILLPARGVAGQGPCPDLSGDYSTGRIEPVRGVLIMTLQQMGCDALATGSYYLSGETQSEVKAPVVTYIRDGGTGVCAHEPCIRYQWVGSAMETFETGVVRTDGVSCSYGKVELALERGDLIRTYFLNDPSPSCRGRDFFSQIFPRVR